MKRIMKRILIVSASFFLTLTAGVMWAFSDGLLIARPQAFEKAKLVPLSVVYHRVSIEIEGGIATTRIDQVFKNDQDADLEGTYIFPIPESAAISDFALYINGRRASGEMLESIEARRIYEDIVRKMKDPGLLEYAGRNMFRVKVYPIPARGKKRVELVYTQPLDYDAGAYRYMYPLNTEKYSPVPIEEVTVSVHITSNVPIKSVYSPSHEIDVSMKQFSARAGFEQKNIRPDRDFILFYTVSQDDVGANILTYREDGETGYFSMLLSPGVLDRAGASKDIVFVVDTSGSMRGKKLSQVKDALLYCLENLNRGDRFNIVQFATVARTLASEPIPADRSNIQKARRFVEGLSARGGTNIHGALLISVDMLGDTNRTKMVVFLTDGEPTVGETNTGKIIRDLLSANRGNARLFVFGVGNDVNTHLLDRIAEQNRGFSDYFRPNENINTGVSAFYRKVSEPVLSDITLDFGRIRVRDIYPVVLPDIFNGTQLVLFGRYEGEGSSSIVLKGTVEGKPERFVFEGFFPAESRKNDFIPGLWAMRKIGYLMNEIRLNGEKKELVDEILLLSKEYGILTPYTSYLILENETDYERWGIGESAAPGMRSKGRSYTRAMEKKVGPESVSSALDIRAMKESKTEPASVMKTVKRVAGKTFYFKDGAWIDADYRDSMRVKRVKLFSNKYFDLLHLNPEIGKYFAVGKNVTFVFDSECYRISE